MLLELAQRIGLVVLLGQQLLQAERGERNAKQGEHGGGARHHAIGRRGAGGERMAAVRGQRRCLQERETHI